MEKQKELLKHHIKHENIDEIKTWIQETNDIDYSFSYYVNSHEKRHVPSALISAIEYEKEEIVDLLLKSGANPNQRTERGQTPLNLAIKKQHIGIVSLLLKYKANVQKLGEFDKSPLFIAVSSLSHDVSLEEKLSDTEREKTKLVIIENLLEAGADPFRQEIWSLLSPFTCAKQSSTQTVIDLLLKYK